MKGTLYFLKRLFQNLFYLVLVLAITYAFLGICNWSLWIGDWNGFSKFVVAVVFLIMSILTYDSLEVSLNTARSLNKRNR